MYNTLDMTNKLEIFKKKLIYRASYRGTKEMDILLSTFVNKYINSLDETALLELEKFLNFEDEILLGFYNQDIVKKKIDKNKISDLFKNFKI
jgi:antitoxin CptB